MSSLIQNIIILGGIIVILGLGYFLYTQNSQLDAGSDGFDAQIEAENAEFLRRLNELKAVELNGAIFLDPRFLSFVDFSIPVLPEAIGDSRPFDPNN